MAACPKDIRLLILDVDGVLTDGGIVVDHAGREQKRFYVRDGFAIRSAQSVGLRIAVLSGAQCQAVNHRMRQLGVDLVIQGSAYKAKDVKALARRAGISLEHTAYLGDDVVDLPALAAVGYPMAVANSSESARQAATYLTNANGGHGAVREAIEHLLQARGQWQTIVEQYKDGSDAAKVY